MGRGLLLGCLRPPPRPDLDFLDDLKHILKAARFTDLAAPFG